MAASSQFKLFLAFGMLLTGCLNTLLTKYQDRICVENCTDPDLSKRKHFEQPIWQTLNMFIGELVCLGVYYLFMAYSSSKYNKSQYSPIPTDASAEVRTSTDSRYSNLNTSETSLFDEPREQDALDVLEAVPNELEVLFMTGANAKELSGWDNFLMWLPTLCDIIASTLLNVGLIYTTASVYQMLRGVVVIFAGFFSVQFLGHVLSRAQWISLGMIMAGAMIVGSSSIIYHDSTDLLTIAMDGSKSKSENIFGIIIILIAQVFSAMHIISEEKILQHYKVAPLRGVGLEGAFGTFTVGMLIPIIHWTYGSKNPGSLLDVHSGFYQIINSNAILMSCFYIMICISLFNWFGLSITKAISATSRSTIDSCRTLFIWTASILMGWEKLNLFQVSQSSFMAPSYSTKSSKAHSSI
ncbi:hypothetical protein BB561_001683 [Smittium simulii]|uniref:EamA domain-containing protein n=1 Tax=Smittium simulii TaxID=133385 RepID=A0A2T9YTM2_9FUNG|nr:hypothetical protein BB561_001683 [Smittium simulii]